MRHSMPTRYIYTDILGDHVAHHQNHSAEEELKAAVYCDLVILGCFRPLIESGRIIPITPPDEFCPGCFGSNPGIRDLDQRRKTIRQWLSEKYLRETEVRLERTGEKFAFVVTGTDVLLGHGTGAWIKEDLPDGLKARRGLVTRLTQGKTIKLSRDASRLAKIHEMNADEILRNVFFELICSQCLGTSFLTERPLDIDVLNKLSEDHALAKRNHLVQEHLTAIVPFLASVRIRDLLALRDKEGDSFLAFRQALTRAIDDYKGCQNQRFNAQDASQLYGDVIEPELAKLDVAFKTARRRLLKGSGVKVVSWVGAIAFGLYSGFIPQQLEQAAQRSD
jgi:hypothetical protein